MTEIRFGLQSATLNPQGGWIDSWHIGDQPILLPRQRLKFGNKKRDVGGMHVCFPYYGKAPKRSMLPENGHVFRTLGTPQRVATEKAEVAYSGLNCLGSGEMLCDVTVGAAFDAGRFTQSLRVAAAARQTGSLRVSPGFRYYFSTPQGVATVYSSTTEVVRSPDFGPKFFKFTGQNFLIGIDGGRLLELVPQGAFWDSRRSLACVWRNDPCFVCVDVLVAHPDSNGAAGIRLTSERPLELQCMVTIRER
ncbi:MAG TPA: hypothetical protein VHC20_07310 [Candidatus Paceibacterota bacterium]|nr:hypothetical protein [Candidatus Paceibacterota bacterium]